MTLVVALAAAGIGYFWYRNLAAREQATRAARQTCRRQELQFLDETVALRGLRLQRDRAGRACLERTYQFEYSEDGANRQRGFVIVRGTHVESVGLAPPGAGL